MGKNKNDGAISATKKWQVPAYNEALMRDGVDAKKLKRMVENSNHEPIEATLLFDTRINGRVRRAGTVVHITAADFTTLGAQGIIKEVVNPDHLKILEDSTPITAQSTSTGGDDPLSGEASSRIDAAEKRAKAAEERAEKAEAAAGIAAKAAREATAAIAALQKQSK